MRILFLLPVACVAFAGPAQAHAVRHEVSGPGVTTVEWHYDDGRPLAAAEVTVLRPGEKDSPFQTGRTDPHGSFSFAPDTNGLWQVTVDDGLGHRADVYIDVDNAGRSTVKNPGTHRHLDRVVVGICVLFGCFGLWSLFVVRTRGRAAGREAA